MGKVDLPNLCVKGGRLYYRRKIGGQDNYIRLPAINDPRFAEAYQRAGQPDNLFKRPMAGDVRRAGHGLPQQ